MQNNLILISNNDDLLYPFYEENLTWKIHQVRYEKLAQKKNYNDYDFLVIGDIMQLCEIDDYRNLKFNYWIENTGKIVSDNGKSPITVYVDEAGKLITYGTAIMQYNIIDLKSIPDNFKLVRQQTTIEEPNDMTPRYSSKKAYIYQKVYQSNYRHNL